MREIRFPPVASARPDGLLAVSRDIGPDYLLAAYRSGVFPWPVDEGGILWFAPPRRALLRFDDLHVPSRLPRALRAAGFDFRFDTAFEEVIGHCATVGRKTQDGTWITPGMRRAYLDFHLAGHAHSFEAWSPDGRLVGGLYGVWLGKFFAGESMFHLQTGASKFALLHAVSHLRNHGLEWMDVQVLNPLTAAFGAAEVPRRYFMRLLRQALALA